MCATSIHRKNNMKRIQSIRLHAPALLLSKRFGLLPKGRFLVARRHNPKISLSELAAELLPGPFFVLPQRRQPQFEVNQSRNNWTKLEAVSNAPRIFREPL